MSLIRYISYWNRKKKEVKIRSQRHPNTTIQSEQKMLITCFTQQLPRATDSSEHSYCQLLCISMCERTVTANLSQWSLLVLQQSAISTKEMSIKGCGFLKKKCAAVRSYNFFWLIYWPSSFLVTGCHWVLKGILGILKYGSHTPSLSTKPTDLKFTSGCFGTLSV